MEPLVTVHPRECGFTLEAPLRNRFWYEADGYEPMSSAVYRTVASDADVLLDIGAHVGYYSLLGKEAAPTATAVAVEASPENAVVLQRNVDASAHPDVRVVPAAFGDRSGMVTFHLAEASDNGGLSSHPNAPTVATVEVPMVTAAELDLPAGRKLVVKIDVEGHELEALTGLEPVFSTFEDVRLLVELNPKCLREAGSGPDQLIGRLESLGFRLFALGEEDWSWREIRPGRPWSEFVDETGYANIYCAPATRCRTVSAVMHYGGTGGAERSHAELAESMVRQGFMVHTVVPEPELGLHDELVKVGSAVTVVPHLDWWMLWPDEDEGAPDAWTRRRLFDETLLASLRDVGADIVLTESGVIPQGALAAAALGLPHVWYVREFGDLDHGLVFPGGRDRYAGAVRELSDLVLTNSSAVRDYLFGDNGDGVSVLNPVPRIDAEVRAGRSGDGPWTVGVVGSLAESKGQADAIEALALLLADDIRVRLVLVGDGREGSQRVLAELAERRGVQEQVEFRGVVTDRAAAYGGIDVVAVTSRSEAFGRVAFEATALGLPVVYADAAGPSEYMEPGVTGLPYTPTDARGLADALRRLHDEPDLGDRLVAAARRAFEDPARRQAFDERVRELFGALGARRARPVLDDVLGSVVGTASDHILQTASDGVSLRVEREIQLRRQLQQKYAEALDALRQRVEAHEALMIEHDRLEGRLRQAEEACDGARQVTDLLRAELTNMANSSAALAASRDALQRDLDAIRSTRTWRFRSMLLAMVGRR